MFLYQILFTKYALTALKRLFTVRTDMIKWEWSLLAVGSSSWELYSSRFESSVKYVGVVEVVCRIPMRKLVCHNQLKLFALRMQESPLNLRC